MREILTAEGYEQTRAKLRDLEARLAGLEQRTDLDAAHLASVRRSYKMIMREFLQDIKALRGPPRHTEPGAATLMPPAPGR